VQALQIIRAMSSYSASDVTVEHEDVTEALPDDLLSKCFFGGFLNSLDIVRSLSCVNKRLQTVAQSTVKLLDLRSCKSLRAVDTSNLVSRFRNLSVSSDGKGRDRLAVEIDAVFSYFLIVTTYATTHALHRKLTLRIATNSPTSTCWP
jgi:hypothetical protein